MNSVEVVIAVRTWMDEDSASLVMDIQHLWNGWMNEWSTKWITKMHCLESDFELQKSISLCFSGSVSSPMQKQYHFLYS